MVIPSDYELLRPIRSQVRPATTAQRTMRPVGVAGGLLVGATMPKLSVNVPPEVRTYCAEICVGVTVYLTKP